MNTAMLHQRLEERPPPAPSARKAVYKTERLAVASHALLGRRSVDYPNLHHD